MIKGIEKEYDKENIYYILFYFLNQLEICLHFYVSPGAIEKSDLRSFFVKKIACVLG